MNEPSKIDKGRNRKPVNDLTKPVPDGVKGDFGLVSQLGVLLASERWTRLIRAPTLPIHLVHSVQGYSRRPKVPHFAPLCAC